MSKNYRAMMYLLTKEEGGRVTPFGLGYRPIFRLNGGGMGTSAIIHWLEGGRQSMSPGEVLEVHMTLLSPEELGQIAVGTRFEIGEGNLPIGWGLIRAVE